MAKTKKTSVEPSEEKVTLEEAAIVAEEMPVTAADEVAEQPAAAEETAASFGDKVKAFGGKIKEKWIHKSCSLHQFCREYRALAAQEDVMIEDFSISKLALMVLSI